MNKIERLQELGKLLKSGVISADEFKSLKYELLTTNEEGQNLETETPDTIHKVKIEKQTPETSRTKRVKQKIVKNFKKPNPGPFIWKRVKKTALFLASIFFIFYVIPHIYSLISDPSAEEIIEQAYPSSEIIKVAKTEFYFVTKADGESNLFDERNNSFVLSKWYKGRYDEGLFYDDIVFKHEGIRISFVYSEFNQISDEVVTEKFAEKIKSKAEFQNKLDYYSTMASCPKCGRSYNEKTWGKMCGSCSRDGKGLTCIHGKAWSKCCASNLGRP